LVDVVKAKKAAMDYDLDLVTPISLVWKEEDLGTMWCGGRLTNVVQSGNTRITNSTMWSQLQAPIILLFMGYHLLV
jgi:hypothetical protein